jgi:hypothetical protein
MKTFRVLVVIGLLMGLLFVDVPTARAVPPLPSSFYGMVKSKGANVPVGMIVSARIHGVVYASTAALVDGMDTVYSFDVPGDDLETPGFIEGGVPGDTIVFYVGNTKADQTALWQSGVNVNLDLTVTLQDQFHICLPLILH